jgi:hypothetical protein
MSRSDMPFLTPTLVSDNDSGYDAADGKLRLIVDRNVSGKEGAAALKAKYLDATRAEPRTGEVENDEADASDADEFKHCDVIAWIPKGDTGHAFTSVESLVGDAIFVVVCDDAATEMSILDLLASLTRTIVTPFSAHDGRAEWKKARHPSVQVVSDWSPADGSFDVPVSRRIATIVEGANRRLDAMYTSVFARKILSAARTAVSRWSKKAGIAMSKTDAKKPSKAGGKAGSGNTADAATPDTATP